MPLVQLPASTIKLISSSQVITSVSSIVKELVENAIDAGASRIDVKLEDNGLSKVEVKDDGCGIMRDDILHACLPSYTSKIQEFQDLDSLQSYGFRGEALSALCHVSDITIITRTAADSHALSYVFNENGSIQSSTISHHSTGTDIIATNLFKNLPVRKQFLKSGRRANDELKRTECVLKSLAIINPVLRVTFSHNKNLLWQKNSAQTLKQSLMHVVGYNISNTLEEISIESNQMYFNLLLPKKDLQDLIVQSNSDCIMVFVNKRPVKHKKLEKILLRHINSFFEGQIPPKKYPHSLLSIDVPPSELDVNLEPNKSQVLFKDEDKVLACMEKLLTSYYELETNTATAADVECSEQPRKKPKVVNNFITVDESEPGVEETRNGNRELVSDKVEEHLKNGKVLLGVDVHDNGSTNGKSSKNVTSILEVANDPNNLKCDDGTSKNENEKINVDKFQSVLAENIDISDDLFDLEIDPFVEPPCNRSYMSFSTKIDHQSKVQDNISDSLNSNHQESCVPYDGALPASCSDVSIAANVNREHEFGAMPGDMKEKTTVKIVHKNESFANELLWKEVDEASEKWMTKLPDSDVSNVIPVSKSTESVGVHGAISKSSTLWNDASKINELKAGNQTSAVLDSVTRDRWSMGQVQTTSGRLLQGSTVLLPTAVNSPGNRSVSSQMGQKENSGFTKFIRIMRPQIFKENPGIDFTKVAGMMVSRWRALDEEERAQYEVLAREVDEERKRKHVARELSVELDPKKKKEKIERFQELLNKSIDASPQAQKKRKTENNLKRMEHKLNISVNDLTKKLSTANSENENKDFSLIGQLKPSRIWMYRHGNEIGIVRHWGLQEVVLCDKLMKNHTVPLTPLESAIVVDEGSLGPDLWRLLLSLDTTYDELTHKVIVSNQHVSKNGFTVEVNKSDDQFSCHLTAVPSVTRFYGIQELKETLQMMLDNGPNCTLNRCRPLKVVYYLEAEAVRMTRGLPSLDRESLDDLLTYWHLHINKEEYKCLHHKPIFTAVHHLTVTTQASGEAKWRNILLRCEK